MYSWIKILKVLLSNRLKQYNCIDFCFPYTKNRITCNSVFIKLEYIWHFKIFVYCCSYIANRFSNFLIFSKKLFFKTVFIKSTNPSNYTPWRLSLTGSKELRNLNYIQFKYVTNLLIYFIIIRFFIFLPTHAHTHVQVIILKKHCK